MDMEFRHKTVLLHETVGALPLSRDGVFVDATAGGGGHSSLIADRMTENSRLILFDKDMDAVRHCREKFISYGSRVTVVHSAFSDIREELARLGIYSINGVIADLGVSSHQIDSAERGFSYSLDAPLDMRMDKRAKLTATEVINGFTEKQLADIFYLYGEERFARKIAKKIVIRREENEISTTGELAEIIKSALPPASHREKQPAARCFQALRIYVNSELEELSMLLDMLPDILEPGGIAAMISFHSLEDRMIKQFFVSRAKGCICPPDYPVCVCNKVPSMEIITKKPVTPSAEELNDNPRARSAKLRIAKKI